MPHSPARVAWSGPRHAVPRQGEEAGASVEGVRGGAEAAPRGHGDGEGKVSDRELGDCRFSLRL